MAVTGKPKKGELIMRKKPNHKSDRSWLTCTLGLILLGLLTGCGGADLGVLHPDTILFNGKIVTVDEEFSIVEAVAIKGQGVFDTLKAIINQVVAQVRGKV